MMIKQFEMLPQIKDRYFNQYTALIYESSWIKTIGISACTNCTKRPDIFPNSVDLHLRKD